MIKEEKEENRGSVEFQVFSFTNKTRRLASHLELHKKDFSSERGLRRLLGKRRRLLAYLAKKNGAVKAKLPLVEKKPQPLGVILRLEEEIGKGKPFPGLVHTARHTIGAGHV